MSNLYYAVKNFSSNSEREFIKTYSGKKGMAAFIDRGLGKYVLWFKPAGDPFENGLETSPGKISSPGYLPDGKKIIKFITRNTIYTLVVE